MPLTLHCVRHAQGYHNLSHANHAIRDPDLTPLGESQCRDLSARFPHHSNISLLLASPLRRTICTALLSFPEESRNLKIVGLPEAQETSSVPCDTGTDPAALAYEMAQKGIPVDLSLVGEGWNSKTGKWGPSSEAIVVRGREARIYIRQLLAELAASGDNGEAILVTHGGFLHFFAEDWEDSAKFDGTSWANTEFRTYTFEDLEDANAPMVETVESRRRRGKSWKQPGPEEQRELYEAAMRAWEARGLQNPSKMGVPKRRDSVGEARL